MVKFCAGKYIFPVFCVVLMGVLLALWPSYNEYRQFYRAENSMQGFFFGDCVPEGGFEKALGAAIESADYIVQAKVIALHKHKVDVVSENGVQRQYEGYEVIEPTKLWRGDKRTIPTKLRIFNFQYNNSGIGKTKEKPAWKSKEHIYVLSKGRDGLYWTGECTWTVGPDDPRVQKLLQDVPYETLGADSAVGVPQQ